MEMMGVAIIIAVICAISFVTNAIYNSRCETLGIERDFYLSVDDDYVEQCQRMLYKKSLIIYITVTIHNFFIYSIHMIRVFMERMVEE